MTRPTLIVGLAACLLVAACGGGATASAAPGSADPSAIATPAAPATASPALVAPTTGGPAGSPMASAATGLNGAALCGFLQAELPALQKAGSEAGAVSVLAIDYADWIAADASRGLPDAAAMDTATEASCPAVRSAVLKLLGGNSFAGAF